MKNFLALFFILPVLVNAQDKLVEKGDELYSLLQYNDALAIYLKAESKLVDSTEKYPILLQIASCYTNLHNPKQAIRYFSAAYSLDNNFTPEQSTDYCSALIETGQYNKAKLILTQLNSGSFIEQILLDKCDYALAHPELDRYIQTQAMKLQEGYSNFGMTLYNKKLLYIQFIKSKNSSDSKCRMVYEGSPDNLLRKLMDEDLPFNINSPSFDITHKIIYFSASASDLKKYTDSKREEEEIGIGGINNLFIWSASLNKDDFTPKKLPFNHIDYSCTHPFITDDGQTLYFSSNMLGSYGGFDLYVVKKTSTGWGPPENLGRKINTVLNEGYPYVNDGYLYFSSDGHPGFGALDIFRYNFTTQEIENLNKPVNSSYDDFSYIQNNEAEGYFSSNRNSIDGSDLIFRFKSSDPEVLKKITSEPTTSLEISKLEISAVNFLTGDSLPNINIRVSNSQGFVELKRTDLSGKTVINLPYGQYKLTGSNNDFKTDSIPVIVNSQRATQTLQLKPGSNNTQKFIYRNLSFNYEKAMVSEKSTAIIDKLATFLTQNPSLSIEIRGYTDSRGESYYNSMISEMMAKSVMNYLIQKGVNERRIKAKGYGDTEILNKCGKGIQCTEEEHAFNKRIEITLNP